MLYRFLQFVFRTFFRLFFRARVLGTENMPSQGAVILAANHQSNWDPPFLATFLQRPVSYMAKQELFEVPVFGAAIRACHAFPIRRGAADRAAIKTALQVLMGIVGSSQGDIRVGAETSVAESAINAAARDRTSTIYVTSVLSYTTASGTWDTPLPNAADGALLQRKGAGMVRSYAAGGIDQPRPVGSIGSRTNGIYPYAGPAGVIMNEAGSGPWEGIVSGHPGKRPRSRVITEEIARRLGGDVQWRFADGGFFGDGSSLPAGGGGVRQLAREIVTMLDSRPIIAQTVIDSKVVAQAVRRSDRSIR